MINIGQTMTNRAYLCPELECFVGDGYCYTFEQANARVNSFASFLLANNMSFGNRMAVLCKNNDHFAVAMYAAAKLGVITVPLNWRLQAPELEYIINDCGADMLVYDTEFAEAVEKIRPSVPVRLYVRAGGAGTDPGFNDAVEESPGPEPVVAVGGENPAVIMYTSGTTGKPKGAVLTHNNLFWASVGLSHTIDWRYQDRFLSVAPLFHIGGMAPLVTNIHKGCTTVFMPNFDPAKVFEIITKEKINNMMTVPMMLSVMLKIPGVENMDLQTLRSIVCGASPVPDSLIRAYLKLGIKVLQVFGITEYTGAVTFWTHDMPLEKSVSMGKPVFHGGIKIIDPNTGEELPPGEVGEILCHGPQVFNEYWNNPEATKKALDDGWYHSGDLGKKDAEGYIYVVDRLKDMIISGGENIYSAEVEAVISTHQSVAEVAVIGVPNAKWGEIPLAVVVKKTGQEITKEEIIGLCKNNLAAYKCVREVSFAEMLPRNSVGKVLKGVLKEKIKQ